MLDIKLIIENPSYVKNALKKKGYDVDFTDVIAKDTERRKLLYEIEQLKAKRNKVSSEIPRLKKEGKPVEHIFQEMREIGEQITAGDVKINALSQEIFEFVACLPNLPDDDLLEGEKENNKVVKVNGQVPTLKLKITSTFAQVLVLSTMKGALNFQATAFGLTVATAQGLSGLY